MQGDTRRSLPSLKSIRESCVLRKEEKSVSRLHKYKSTYDGNEQKQQQANPQLFSPVNSFDPEIARKSKAICSKLSFELQRFQRLFAVSRRKKAIISSLYGWNEEEFGKIMFFREEIRVNLDGDRLHQQFGLSQKTPQVRITYNRLRFFLKELTQFNEAKEEADTKYFKDRLKERLLNLQGQFAEIRGKSNLALNRYVKEMKETHNDMRSCKIKIKNRGDAIQAMAAKIGRFKITPFFLSEERHVNKIEGFIKGE